KEIGRGGRAGGPGTPGEKATPDPAFSDGLSPCLHTPLHTFPQHQPQEGDPRWLRPRPEAEPTRRATAAATAFRPEHTPASPLRPCERRVAIARPRRSASARRRASSRTCKTSSRKAAVRAS